MARKRMIDPDIWTDEKVQSLPSTLAVALYIGTISMADDAGRIEWSSLQLKTRLLPNREDVTLRHIETAMAALVTLPNELKHTADDEPLLVAYTVRGRNYAYHPNWRKHQYVNRPSPSKLPAPPDNTGGIAPSNGRSDSVQSPDRLQTNSATKNGATTGATPDSLREISDSRRSSRSNSVPLDSESESETQSESGVESDARNARELTRPTRDLGKEATKHYTQHDDVIGDEEIDLPQSPISAVPSPVLDFAKWFVLNGVEAGVIPKHRKLDALDYALDRDGKLKAANQLIETYGRAECEVRTHRLFRAINAKVCNTASIEALSALWDKPDIAGSAGVPGTPRLHVAGEFDTHTPLPKRGFELDKRLSEDVPVIGTPRTKCPACGASDHTEAYDCPRFAYKRAKNA
jgi:hypothetical protein